MRFLQAESLPLSGRHIIEASAGTGKTYNITRLYLRLLLSQKLTVQQILVVTFTQAATEELKGRIARELRNAIDIWQQAPDEVTDPVYAQLRLEVSEEEAKTRLDLALLHLDEASILTIHGFCSRVLAEHNMLAGLPFDIELATDTRKMVLQAIEDQYRRLSMQPDAFALILNSAPNAQAFLQQYSRLIDDGAPLVANQPDDIRQAHLDFLKRVSSALLNEQALILANLVLTGKDEATHQQAWEDLLTFFAATPSTYQTSTIEPSETSSADFFTRVLPANVKKFMNGNRFSRKPEAIKTPLKAVFDLVKEYESDYCKKYTSKIAKASLNQVLVEVIQAIRQAVTEDKQQKGQLGFNDLINCLSLQLQKEQTTIGLASSTNIDARHQVTDETTRETTSESLKETSKDTNTHAQSNTLTALLSSQYPAILVDEFQDTDPEQYAIFNLIQRYNEQHLLLMIGDPKQAIYKFRGGDIFTYLAARDQAHYQWQMDTNYRSSFNMVDAYNRLFYGEDLPPYQHEAPETIKASSHVFGFDIDYTPVKAAHEHDLTIDDEQERSALSLISFDAGDDQAAQSQQFRGDMADWFASEIKRLLNPDNPVMLNSISSVNQETEQRPVAEQDIAILVRDFSEANDMQRALKAAGLSSVYLSNRENIYKTLEATHWLRCLQGILLFENERYLISALATPLMGLNNDHLAQLQQDERLWEVWRERIIDLRHLWQTKGFISMAFYILHHYTQPTLDTRERQLTNYLHLIELIQARSQQMANPQQLVDWLERQVFEPDINSDAELRLESDSALIRIVTLHGSKGLEYPIVFVPYATRSKGGNNPRYFQLFDDKEQLSVFYLGDDAERIKQAEIEQQAEDIRLLYVAVTRAVYRCYLGVSLFKDAYKSPLGLTLGLTKSTSILSAVNGLAAKNVNINITNVVPDESMCDSQDPSSNKIASTAPVTTTDVFANANARTFTGYIEQDWLLHSFSGLTRHAHQSVVAAIEYKEIDEEHLAQTPDGLPQTLQANKAVCFTFPKGATSGLLLHEIFEHLDFDEPDFEAAWPVIEDAFNEADLPDKTGCFAWFDDCLQAELDSNTGLRLADLSHIKTLREVAFYFPMEQVKTQALLQYLAQHRGADVSPFIFADNLQGMMNGVIDLVFEWQGRYYVADYKSNFLGDRYQDYNIENMQQSMQSSFYDLQYLIYTLALHRYLAKRIPDYDPDTHLGGSYYLYLRGMRAGKSDGIYHQMLTGDEIRHLDAIFSGCESSLTPTLAETVQFQDTDESKTI